MSRIDPDYPGETVAESCGTCNPPADGTADREVIDRFRDFLAVAGPPAVRQPDGTWAPPARPPRTAAERYRFRFLVWRMEAFDATADRQLLSWWEPTP